nr:hypothetical protein [uncultured Undibacterium sp.]
MIIAAMHQNFAGIYYEQLTPFVIQGKPTAEQLGSAFRDAFNGFSIKDANLSGFNRSDWPAFKASDLHTVKEFERRFKSISCVSCNSSNAVVRASVAHPTHPSIEMSVSFNPLAAPETIGVSLLHLFEAANAT